jgi:hypothetical protein
MPSAFAALSCVVLKLDIGNRHLRTAGYKKSSSGAHPASASAYSGMPTFSSYCCRILNREVLKLDACYIF